MNYEEAVAYIEETRSLQKEQPGAYKGMPEETGKSTGEV